jgi:hypothetical protein
MAVEGSAWQLPQPILPEYTTQERTKAVYNQLPKLIKEYGEVPFGHSEISAADAYLAIEMHLVSIKTIQEYETHNGIVTSEPSPKITILPFSIPGANFSIDFIHVDKNPNKKPPTIKEISDPSVPSVSVEYFIPKKKPTPTYSYPTWPLVISPHPKEALMDGYTRYRVYHYYDLPRIPILWFVD